MLLTDPEEVPEETHISQVSAAKKE